jgi:chorismate-pyruvate lyase
VNTFNDSLTRILEADRLNVALAQLRNQHARLGRPSPDDTEAEIERVVAQIQQALAEAFPAEPPADADAAQLDAIAGASKALLREILLHFHRAIDQTPFIGPSTEDSP